MNNDNLIFCKELFVFHLKDVCFTTDCSKIITSEMCGTITLYPFYNVGIIKSYNYIIISNSTSIKCNSKYIIVGCFNGEIKLIDINTGKITNTFNGDNSSIIDAYITNDNKYIYTASYNGFLRIYDMNTSYIIKTININCSIKKFYLSNNYKYYCCQSVLDYAIIGNFNDFNDKIIGWNFVFNKI